MIKIPQDRQYRYVFFLIIIIVFFHAINNYYVIKESSFDTHFDAVTYFRETCHLAKNIKSGHYFWKLVNFFIASIGYIRPPLFFLIASPFLLVRMNMLLAITPNLIYLGILLFATFGIGKELYNFEIGIIAAFLISLFPGIFAISRYYLLDLALASFVIFSLYMMIKLLNSKGKKRVLLFFLTTFSIVLGLLIKESYFCFIPLLPSFLLIKREYLCRNNIISVFAAILLALLLVSGWYLRFGLRAFIEAWVEHANVVSSNDNLFYVKKLYEFQLMPLFFWFLLISLVYYLIKKDLFPIIFVVFPLATFSMISQNKDGRYILPIFSFIALMIARTLWDFTKGNKCMILFFFVLALMQFFLVNYTDNKSLAFTRPLAYRGGSYKFTGEGIYGITRIITYRETAKVIIELIDFLDNKCLLFNKDLSILVLAEDEKERLYYAMEELLAPTIKKYKIMQSYKDGEIELIIRAGGTIEAKATDYKYLVCENPPNFTWLHSRIYYDNFLKNIKRYTLIRTIWHSSGIKFDVYVRDYITQG